LRLRRSGRSNDARSWHLKLLLLLLLGHPMLLLLLLLAVVNWDDLRSLGDQLQSGNTIMFGLKVSWRQKCDDVILMSFFYF
jgi:hypothetical protein